MVQPRVERLEPADRVLLFTDGLAEARRDGEFFPTAERAWGCWATAGSRMGWLVEAAWWAVRGRLDDDIALVL